MMDISFVLFVLFLILLIMIERRSFKREGIAFLRRTKKGIRFVEHYGKKYEKVFNFLGDVAVVISYGVLSYYYILKEKTINTVYKIFLLLLYMVVVYFSFIYSGLVEHTYNVLFKDINLGFMLYVLLFFSLVFGFGGLAFSTVLLGAFSVAYNNLFLVRETTPPLQIVLPVSVPESSNLPIFSVPFDKWIISIIIIVIVHELAHAFLAAANRIKVKSMGYGFFLILPLGFAEPDEKSLKKKPVLSRLRVYAAGSFSNFLFALLFGLMFFPINMILQNIDMYEFKGIGYEGLVNETNAYWVLPENGTITHINNIKLKNFTHFAEVLNSFKPGENITLTIDGKNFTLQLVENPTNTSKPFIGIKHVTEEYDFKKDVKENKLKIVLFYILIYLGSLFLWISLLNLGIGIANLLPMIPVDGGLMIKDMIPHKGTYIFITFLTISLLLISIFGNIIF